MACGPGVDSLGTPMTLVMMWPVALVARHIHWVSFCLTSATAKLCNSSIASASKFEIEASRSRVMVSVCREPSGVVSVSMAG